MLSGRPGSGRRRCLWCWRASSVVGTTTATCLPLIAVTKAARSATSVLPKPTSPQTSRSIGRPGAEIVEHRVDGVELVLGLLVGEAGRELVVEALRRHEARRILQHAGGGDLHERAGHLADALLHARLAGLPGAAAEPVELDLGLLRPVAGQELDVLDRQEQAVAAGIVDFEAVMRRACRLDGLAGPRSGRCRDRRGRRGRPGVSAATSVRKSCGRFDLRFGRTRRSPRMSCSLMTARSPASKPASRPQTAIGTSVLGKREGIGVAARPASSAAARDRAGRGPRRSREPSDQAPRMTRRPCPCRSRTCRTAASKTLAPSSARSAMKLRPRRARNR